jgi:hypothetical protein
LRARERLADSLFESILLRLRSSPALPLPLPPSTLLSGLELRRDGDDMVGFFGQEPEKISVFGGERKERSK